MSAVFSLTDLLSGTKGTALVTKETSFTAIATDTREENQGKIFFALKGDNFDAHEFLPQAVKSGASALVVQGDLATYGVSIEELAVTIVKVEDTLKALQNFAHYWRKKLKTKVIAITGSNGKTTTKEFAATILSEKFRTHHSVGSFNNHFGVPMSLLALRSEHQIAIQEMGMNHPGEIEQLVKIADPDIVCVTTVGRAHLEFMGSLQRIADAKEEIYRYARPSAARIYNLDNQYTKPMLNRAPATSQVITFSSLDSGADVHLKERVSTLDFMEISGSIGGEPRQTRVEVFGRQNVSNLMAAASLALAAGVEPDRIWAGLSKCKSIWGRNQIFNLSGGGRAIFDAYNANPDSVAALIENVSRLKVAGRKFAVIGEMLEMGSHSDEVHQEIGRKLGEGQYELIWFIGSKGESFAKGLKQAGWANKLIISDSYDEKVAGQVGHMLQGGDIVLMKGSRGMKLEKIMQLWGPQGFTQKKY
jgi:UDP-N-acetylmuramoyl-tripeptide--D-alanyl-D-alanine ligase